METLVSLFPTADDLLAMSRDDLGPISLTLAANAGGAGFWPTAVTEIKVGTGIETTIEHAHPFHKRAQVDALLQETWERLRRDGLIMPAPGINGQNGYMVLTKDGATRNPAEWEWCVCDLSDRPLRVGWKRIREEARHEAESALFNLLASGGNIPRKKNIPPRGY